MTRYTVLTVVGARPQFIKAAVVSRALRDRGHPYTEIIIHTGQHYDPAMSQVFFDELDIPEPARNLGVQGGSHGKTTASMLSALEEEMLRIQPDAVLTYGDTNSTLAAALAASKLNIPLVHVEAGLRSHNRSMPEEINRILTDHASDLLLCPSRPSSENLWREGITQGVRVIGDTMYDAVLHYSSKSSHVKEVQAYALATLHRAENTDNPTRLRGILGGLADAPIPIVIPAHPRTEQTMTAAGLSWPPSVRALSPVPYLEMLSLVAHSAFVITDSGGLQKEAFFLGKPCVTLRDETEWCELVELGVNRLVGSQRTKVARGIQWALQAEIPESHLYGDGTAGLRVVDEITNMLPGLPLRADDPP